MEYFAYMINFQRDLTLAYNLYLIYNNEVDKISKFEFANIRKKGEFSEEYCVSTKFFNISNQLIEQLKNEQYLVYRSIYDVNQLHIHPNSLHAKNFVWKDLKPKGKFSIDNGFIKGNKEELLPEFTNCAFHT